jgi:hypothetical protein
MGGNDPAPPHAYSTQLGGDYQSGYRADGYNVVIDPDQLRTSIDTFRQGLQGKDTGTLIETITTAMVGQDCFGQLPNAPSAFSEVHEFVQNHALAMREMGISLEDFVARVQAAADLGYQADPETKRQAAAAARHHGDMYAE